jgi:hypothetical protein
MFIVQTIVILVVGLIILAPIELVLRFIIREEVLDDPTMPRIHSLVRGRLKHGSFTHRDRQNVRWAGALLAIGFGLWTIFLLSF